MGPKIDLGPFLNDLLQMKEGGETWDELADWLQVEHNIACDSRTIQRRITSTAHGGSDSDSKPDSGSHSNPDRGNNSTSDCKNALSLSTKFLTERIGYAKRKSGLKTSPHDTIQRNGWLINRR